jgi:hypothetical protein
MPSTQGIFRQRLGSQVDAFASKIESLAGKVKMVERVLGADASMDGSDANDPESSGLTSLEENPMQCVPLTLSPLRDCFDSVSFV